MARLVLARTSLGEEVPIRTCGRARERSASADLRAILNERDFLVRLSLQYLKATYVIVDDEALLEAKILHRI
jgi:hypothetical protein